VYCCAASGSAGAGSEAGSGGGAGTAAGADSGGGSPPPGGGSDGEAVLEAKPLQDLFQRLMSAEAAAAGEAAAELVRLGAADDGLCDAIAAAADLPQLLRLLRISIKGGFKYIEEAYEDADDFYQENEALQRSLLAALADRASGDRAVCEAAAAKENFIPLLMGHIKDSIAGDGASAALAALAEAGGERCRAALFASGCLKTLVRTLGGETQEASCAARVLAALAAACSDAERDALLAAGAAPLLAKQLSIRVGERPRGSAACIVLSSVSALRHLATTTEHARGRVAEVSAAGGVAALIGLLDETLRTSSWWLDWSEDLSSAAEAALVAMGEEHRRGGGAVAAPFLSAEDAEALRDMAAGTSRWVAVGSDGSEQRGSGEEGEEGGEDDDFFEDNEQRAAAAARLLALLA